MNGVNLLHFQPPGHLDHPGFPLQILIAITLKFVFIVRYTLVQNSNLALKNDFVLHSEIYATGVVTVLILIQVISVFYLCYRIYHLYYSWIVALYPILILSNFEILNFITTVRPESLLFSLTNILLALFISYLQDNSLKRKIVSVSYMGLIIALGILTKITFAPFLILIFFLRPIKLKMIFALSFASVLILLLVPIRSNLSPSWFINILTNRGRHGTYVEPKDFSQFINSIQDINNQVTPYFYLSLLSFAFFFLFRNSIDSLSWNILTLTISLILVFSLLNFKDTSPQDFVSLTSICSLIVVISLIEVGNLTFKFLSMKIFLVNYLLIFILIAHLFYSVLLSNHNLLQLQTRDSNHIKNSLYTKSGAYIISSFKVPTQFSALMFGNFYYGPGIVSDELYSKYPRNIEFNIWDNQFYNARGNRLECHNFLGLLENSNEIFVIANSLELFASKAGLSGYSIKLSQKGTMVDGWSIAQVDSIECKLGK